MSAQCARQVAFLGAARDRDGAKTHLDRELDTEMTKATNRDGDQIAGRAPVWQRVNMVSPAHASGAASTADRSSGCRPVRSPARRIRRSRRGCAGDHAGLAVPIAAPTAAAVLT
jgi:hypothetical protein